MKYPEGLLRKIIFVGVEEQEDGQCQQIYRGRADNAINEGENGASPTPSHGEQIIGYLDPLLERK